jgi:hypothetical protein
MNSSEAKTEDALRLQRKRAIEALLNEVARPVPFTLDQINAGIATLERDGKEISYFSIYNTIKNPEEPEMIKQEPMTAAERKRLQRLREKAKIGAANPSSGDPLSILKNCDKRTLQIVTCRHLLLTCLILAHREKW